MIRRWLLGGAALLLAALAIVALVRLPADRPPPFAQPTSALPGSSPERAAPAAAGVRQAPTRPAAAEPAAAWREVDVESVAELPPYKEVVPGRALVRVSESLRSLDVGDPIVISVPQLGETWRTFVEEVERGPGEVRSLIGALTESGGRRREFVVTTGKRYVFAWLSTAAGTFELVAPGELGWLMPSANMDQHVDYSKPDYYLPRRGAPPPFGARRPRDELDDARSGRPR